EFPQLGMTDRFAGTVVEKVLLRHIGDVFRLVVLGQQVIEWLVLRRPDFGRDRLVPFVGVGEFGIDVEDDAPEREQPMADHLANSEFCYFYFTHVRHLGGAMWRIAARNSTISQFSPRT